MSQTIICLASSLEQFGYKCYMKRAADIDINFHAPIKNRTLAEIDPYGAGIDNSRELIVVPLQITCLGKAAESEMIYYRPSRSLRPRYFAYYHKPEAGYFLAPDSLANLEDICEKAERYAKLAAIITTELAEAEQQPYDFTINLFITVLPHGKKQKILKLNSEEIQNLPPAEDYASILSKQQHSSPWL